MSVSPSVPRLALRRLLTSPLLAIVLLGGFTLALLTEMRVHWALATVAAASGVSLAGST
jgi:hypothetical protein